MLSRIINTFLTFTILFLVFVFIPSSVVAQAPPPGQVPNLEGYVIDDLGGGISGAIVTWTATCDDNRVNRCSAGDPGCDPSCASRARSATTPSTDPVWKTTSGTSDPTKGPGYFAFTSDPNFTCYHNPHNITIQLPSGVTGNCEWFGFNMNNVPTTVVIKSTVSPGDPDELVCYIDRPSAITPTPVPAMTLGLTIKENSQDTPPGQAGGQYGWSGLRQDDPAIPTPDAHAQNFYNSLDIIPKVTGGRTSADIKALGFAFTSKTAPPSNTGDSKLVNLMNSVNTLETEGLSSGFITLYANCGGASNCEIGGQKMTRGKFYVYYNGAWRTQTGLLQGENYLPTPARFEIIAGLADPLQPVTKVRLYHDKPTGNRSWGTYVYVLEESNLKETIQSFVTPSSTFLPFTPLYDYLSFMLRPLIPSL